MGSQENLPKSRLALECALPLWKVVPLRDEFGKPLSDFMMLVPGLRKQAPSTIEANLHQLHIALLHHREVVFAHFNLATNLLWVSYRSRPGLMLEIAEDIRARVPRAVLVGHKPER